jgi:hypothetical protein
LNVNGSKVAVEKRRVWVGFQVQSKISTPRGIPNRPFARFEFDRLGRTLKEEAMRKISFVVAIVALAAACPAYAADLCTDAHMKQMDKMIAEMTDATKQKEATAALDQSKTAMEKGDKAGCMKHMADAHKAMGM